MMKVSVILPVYNNEKHLIPCLESLLNQSIIEYEVICVDDGSIDASSYILDVYQTNYPKIFKVFHKENGGVYKAREFGLKYAEGEYVGFCDSDDTIDFKMYETLYSIAKDNGSELAVCAYHRIDELTDKILCTEMTGFGNQTVEISKCMDLLPVINTALWNKLIKREVAQKHITFDIAPKMAEDMMFLLSIYPYVKRICFCSQPLYFYYIRRGSSINNVKIEECQQLKKCMIQTKKIVEQTADKRWKDVVNLFAFINLGIIAVLKMSESNTKNISNIQQDMEKCLNKEFKGWKKSRFLRSRYVFNGHLYLAKPMFALWLYKLKLFPLFMKLYIWITNHLKIDLKW